MSIKIKLKHENLIRTIPLPKIFKEFRFGFRIFVWVFLVRVFFYLVQCIISLSARLNIGFVYLLAIIDWYSCYILIWKLSITWDSDFCVSTFEEPIKKNKVLLSKNVLISTQSSLSKYFQFCDPVRQELTGHLRLLVWGPE